MPTGYTYAVAEGKMIEFSDFALSCARAFGALITMREEPTGADIPEEFTPDTKYHDEHIANDMKRMGQVQDMTLAEADTAALEVHRAALASRAKYLADRDAEAGRLNAMLAKVRAWHPPTPDHVEMKKFMVDQLTISLPGDYAPAIPALLDGAAWRQQEIDRLADSVVYHRKERSKEIERASGRTEWVKALRRSLSPCPQERP